jgi:DNA-binding response OmpR family regulator
MDALIIEQNLWITLMIEDSLKDLGYESFRYAATAETGVAMCRNRQPTLIVADLDADPAASMDLILAAAQVPLIVMTDVASEVRKRHPDLEVIQKPFSVRDFQRAAIAGAL